RLRTSARRREGALCHDRWRLSDSSPKRHPGRQARTDGSRRIRLAPAVRSMTVMKRIAILDDYQNVSLEMADWSPLAGRAVVTVFNDHLSKFDEIVERLLPFDVVCVMRERTPLPRSVIERLPRLKLIVSTGPKNASIDADAAREHAIAIKSTRGSLTAPIKRTWALIMASARLTSEAASLRAGGWQRAVGDELAGKTLGV